MQWTSLAARQAGLISRRQLLWAGNPPSTIDRWLDGRLERTATDGIYRVAGSAIGPESAVWFASLSTRSPVSFLTAARWWGMPVPDDGLEHVTRLARRRLTPPAGVRVHRVALRRSGIARHRGLWVTTPSETVLDCLGWLPLGRAAAFGDRAVQQRWIDADDVARRLDGEPGRWGNRQLRRIAAQLHDGAAAASERRLHRLLRQAGITAWLPNLPFVAGGSAFSIDVAFPRLRVAIEIDGFEYHSRADRFQNDRTKQNALIAAGWRVLRFTWADLHDRPADVIGQILHLVAA